MPSSPGLRNSERVLQSITSLPAFLRKPKVHPAPDNLEGRCIEGRVAEHDMMLMHDPRDQRLKF